MSSKMTKAVLITITIVVVTSFATGISVSAQDNSICGWIQNNSSPTGVLDTTLTVWGTNEVISLDLLGSELFRPFMNLGIPGYFRVYDPLFQYPGYMTNYSHFEKVSTCEPLQIPTNTRIPPTATRIPPTATRIPPTATWTLLPIPTITPTITLTQTSAPIDPASQVAISPSPLPLHPDCIRNITITTRDIPPDWQLAVQNAVDTWNEAGSNLKIQGFNTVTDAQRVFTAVDFNGEAIDWYPNGSSLRLARCEIRVIMKSTLPAKAMDSVSQRITAANTLSGWVQIYSLLTDGHTIAAVVVLNNTDFTWATTSDVTSMSLDAQSIALHELGHVLGLIHVTEVDAVMNGVDVNHFYQLMAGVQKRTLAPADIKQLTDLYGSAKQTQPQNKPTVVTVVLQVIQDFGSWLFNLFK